jgi:hypothetical protein
MPNHISSKVQNAITQAMESRRKKRPQSIEAFLELLNGMDKDNSFSQKNTIDNSIHIQGMVRDMYFSEQDVMETTEIISSNDEFMRNDCKKDNHSKNKVYDYLWIKDLRD